jgi:hypothetical protein
MLKTNFPMYKQRFMKRITFSFLFFTNLFLFSGFIVESCAPDPSSSPKMHTELPPESDTLTKAEIALMRNGDIVLRAGSGMVSSHIIGILNEPIPLSHCGVFYHTPQGDSVISSESRALQEKDGVQSEPLWLFIRDSKPHSMLIVRPHGTLQQAQAVVTRAKHYLAQNIPFDYAFDIREPTSFYCAELLQHIFIDVYKKDILNETLGTNKPLLRMQQFYDPQKFDIIIQHPKNAKE